MSAPRVPRATYRLQLSGALGFAAARDLVPYLDALGVSHLYSSPLFQARTGSTHGYDVTDPTRLNPELGAEGEFDGLAAALAGHGMGLLLDIVPNHMAASPENPWWMDLLESGPDSPFAGHFDVDWQAPKRALTHKVLLPILGAPYGTALERGELLLALEPAGFFLRYFGTKLPLALRSTVQALSHRIEEFEQTWGASHPAFVELMDLIAAIEHLPQGVAGDVARAAERFRSEEEIKARLWSLAEGRAEVRGFLDENLRIFNGRAGDPASFALLDRLLDDQHWWLSYWRLANEEINYRRFFAISELVSVRVEDPRVFAVSHGLVARLAREGKVQGLRVDHIDGLYDPLGYLRALRGTLADAGADGLYLVVEKILQEGEALPAEWPVDGTTGYDFLTLLGGIFVHGGGARELASSYARFIDGAPEFRETLYERKRLILETLFAGEMYSLGQHLGALAERDRHARDLPRKELREAIVEVTARFPVYRTYVRDSRLSARDRLSLARALREAERAADEPGAPAFAFLRRVLLLEPDPGCEQGEREERLRFLMRWQQFTGPIMAKGFEDTALYVHHPLSSLNEVGGAPDTTGASIPALHARLAQQARRWPHTMTATSTHDTKRSEDVRARISVLSEIPEEWSARLSRWSALNEGKKTEIRGRLLPGRNEEYLLYQTLLGAWPLERAERPGFLARIEGYMLKAVREAKVHTRWIRPQPAYEEAVARFVRGVLDERRNRAFLKDFLQLQRTVAFYGALNALSQLLVKCAAPGVPDFYQGCELWNLRLVDPDNRAPADFGRCRRILEELRAAGDRTDPARLLREWQDGRIKLWLTWKALELRRRRPGLFAEGAYLPLEVSGGKRDLVAAFARSGEGGHALLAVPRFFTRLCPVGGLPVGEESWGRRGAVLLPAALPGAWRNVLTGETLAAAGRGASRGLPLASLFGRLPYALLESAGPAAPPGEAPRQEAAR